MKQVAMFVALATGLGAAAAGCEDAPAPGAGDVMLTVTVPGDVHFQSADYTIDDRIHAPVMGTMTSPYPLQRLDKLVAQIAASDHYTVSVRADSTDNKGRCEGGGSLEISKGATARVKVALMCVGGGSVHVGIGVNCRANPLVDFFVSPVSAGVGESVLGRATQLHPDAGALTYAWSAPSGTFGDARAAQTTFICAKPGPVEVSLRVVDGEACAQSYSAVVTCVALPDAGADAGNG